MKTVSLGTKTPIQPNGFTIFELIAVMAVMSVLIAMVTPSVVSTLSERDIVNAVDIASDIAATARQQSLTKGSPIAFILSPAAAKGNTDNCQSLLLLEAVSNASGTTEWKPATQWIKLPSTVLLTPYSRNGIVTFYSGGTNNIQAPSLPTQVAGRDLSNCTYIVFFPDGSVSSQANNPALSLQRTNKNNTNPDYVLLIQGDSGRVKIIAQ